MQWRRGWAGRCVLIAVWGGVIGGTFTAASAAERVQRELAARRVVRYLQADAARAARIDRLEAATGGAWSLRWDAVTQVAVRGAGGDGRGSARPAAATIAAEASRFAAEHADLLGARGVTLQQARLEAAGRAWHVTWLQHEHGRRVLGCYLDLTLSASGRVVAFKSTLVPKPNIEGDAAGLDWGSAGLAGHLGSDARAESNEEVVAIVPGDAAYRAVAAREWIVRAGHAERWRAVVAHSGELLVLENLVRTRVSGQATIQAQPAYADEAAGVFGAGWLEVRMGSGEDAVSTFADAEGSFAFGNADAPVMLYAGLSGRFATVDNETSDPTPRFEMETTNPSGVVFALGSRWSRPDERTIYHHMNVAHDFALERFGYTALDFPVPALAGALDPATGDPNYPNAYWNGERMGFGNGGRTYFNLGMYRDVIYHEYGHAITDYIYRPVAGLVGHVGGAIHEALADYYAATLTNEPLMGERLLRDGSPWLRRLDNQLIWPDDQHASDVHLTGGILGGVFWDVRQLLGAATSDLLVHFAGRLFPQDFEEYMDAMLVQDDLIFGDAYGGNGSPHRGAVLAAFGQHGIGPLGERTAHIAHLVLGDVEDASAARQVRATIVSSYSNRPQFMRLYHTTGETFTGAWMTLLADGTFTGTLPAQPPGTRVRYYLGAAQQHPVIVATLPVDAPATTFAYDVGPDVEPPQIEHVPVATVATLTWPAALAARIHDNLGIATAFADYWLNGVPGARVGFAPSAPGSDLWVAELPNVGGMVGDVVEYAVTAIDASAQAHVTRFPEQGTLRFIVTDVVANDFESPNGLWLQEALVPAHPGSWQLTSDANHTPGGTSAWLCGDLEAGYPPRTAAGLSTPWYALGSGAHCSIWSAVDARAMGGDAIDGGRVEIQVHGASTWTSLAPATGYTHAIHAGATATFLAPGDACLSGADGSWTLLSFDLAAWAGERVRLRFVFTSDTSPAAPEYTGWLLDDFDLDPGSQLATDTPAIRGSTRLLQTGPSPNPFNPHVMFSLQVPAEAGVVRLDVIDAGGRVVRRLADGAFPAGPLRLEWDGSDGLGLASPSGVYYYRLESVLGIETGKLVLVR